MTKRFLSLALTLALILAFVPSAIPPAAAAATYTEVVPPRYGYEAWPFSEGLARVAHDNFTWRFIDKSGNETIALVDVHGMSDFSDGLAYVHYFDNDTTGFYFVDKTGKQVVPPKYDRARSFSDGLAAVAVRDEENDFKWGFIDTTGNEVVPLIYDETGDFAEGLAGVSLNGKWGAIDTTGKEVVPVIYDRAFYFSEGMAGVSLDGKPSVIDKTGKEIMPLDYAHVGSFSEGLAMVAMRDGETGYKWGFIDATGKEIVPPRYDRVENFSNGLAAVAMGDWENGFKWGFIDKNGNEVVPVGKYDELGDHRVRDPRLPGLQVQFYGFLNDGMVAVQLDGKWGFIDKTGKEIVPPQYDHADNFSEGFAVVGKNPYEITSVSYFGFEETYTVYEYSLIDKTGAEVISFGRKYTRVERVSEGMVAVVGTTEYNDSAWGYISITADSGDTPGGGDTPPPSSGGDTAPPPSDPPPSPSPEPTAEPTPAVIEAETTVEDGKADAAVTPEAIAAAIADLADDAEELVIAVAFDEDVEAVEVTVPAEAFQSIVTDTQFGLTVETPLVNITFDAASLETIAGADEGAVAISAALVADADIPEEYAEIIGDRPVFQFSVTNGDTQVSSFGGTVTVAIPYELGDENPNALVVYYINADGSLVVVRGRYDAERGAVVLTTTHFSMYAVGYNPVTFTDVPATHANKAAIDFIAAREIALGIGGDLFGPAQNLTRAQLLVMLMKAFGYTAEDAANYDGDNFDDAEGWYAGWLGLAKRDKIAAGIGGNKFGLDTEVTHEQMLLLLYNTLDALDEVPADGDAELEAKQDEFSDWAVADDNWEKILAVLSWGVYPDDEVDPQETYTRAQMAHTVYSLLTR